MASLVLAWLLAGIVASSAVSVPLYSGDKPRSIRGFKNHALSTARGFGKRSALELTPSRIDDHSDYHHAPPPLEDVSSLPVEWFVNEMQNNGALARLVVLKFLDSNEDGLLTTRELLRPLLVGQQLQPLQ